MAKHMKSFYFYILHTSVILLLFHAAGHSYPMYVSIDVPVLRLVRNQTLGSGNTTLLARTMIVYLEPSRQF